MTTWWLRQSVRPALSAGLTSCPTDSASCSTRLGKCSASLYWRMTESMSTPSASGGPRTSTISPSGFAWRDVHSRRSTTTLSPSRAGRPGVARRRHVDVLGDARVVRDDVKKLLAPLERADQLRPRPLQDAHHAARGLFGTRCRGICGRTSRRTSTWSPCIAVEVASCGIRMVGSFGSSACRKPTPARFMRMRPGTRSAASGSA